MDTKRITISFNDNVIQGQHIARVSWTKKATHILIKFLSFVCLEIYMSFVGFFMLVLLILMAILGVLFTFMLWS